MQRQLKDEMRNILIFFGLSASYIRDLTVLIDYTFRSKKWDVPVEKIYNKTQRDKFAWAIDMAEADFKF